MYLITSRVIVLFALVFLGFYIGKRKIMPPDIAPQLSNFIVKITFPATVFLSMVRPYDETIISHSVILFVVAFIFHLCMLAFGLVVTKVFRVDKKAQGVWIFVCMFSNNGFMGFPLAMGVYGDEGMMLIAFANVATNLLIFSIGKKVITKNYDIKDKINFRQMFLTNINLAVIIGLIFFIFKIPLPEIVETGAGYVSDITAGLSMIVVGLSLSRADVKSIIKGADMWIMAGIRLVVIPLIVIAFVKCVPAFNGTLMGQIFVLMAALPTASTVSLLSEQFHTNVELAAKMVFSTTLLSVVTIPIMMSFVS